MREYKAKEKMQIAIITLLAIGSMVLMGLCIWDITADDRILTIIFSCIVLPIFPIFWAISILGKTVREKVNKQ